MLPARDAELVQIVDASLADAHRRAHTAEGGSWLACRPGCTPCCHGIFVISALDGVRLRSGLRALAQTDPQRAAAVQARAAALAQELAPCVPGNPRTGKLDEPEGQAWRAFADLPEADAPCPVLDPLTGRCDLYAARPLTCRLFGPPLRNQDGLGFCELCYVGATEAEIFAGELHVAHGALEAELEAELPAHPTIIAWAVRPRPDIP